MARIKSAVELAMEKVENVVADKDAIDNKTLKAEGRKLAQAFMAAPDTMNLQAELKKTPGKKAEAVKEGIIDILLSYVQLPSSDTVPAVVATAGKGFSSLKGGLIEDKKIPQMFKQIEGFLKQFADDAKNLEETARKQYAPKLKQKEQELSARSGRPVHIDPLQDPEFITFYSKNMNALKTQYQDALDKAKEELASMVK